MAGHLDTPDHAPTAIDLFAGCGGVTAGLLRSGIDVRYAYELDDMARLTYHTHHCEPHQITLRGDATDVDASLRGEIDIVFAGPPCQEFSSNQGETKTDSELNRLPFVVVQWAEAVEPSVCVIENVEGMRHHHEMTVAALVDEMEAAGYRGKVLSINAMKHGVPQARERTFLVFVREAGDDDVSIPGQWQPPAICNESQRSLAAFSSDFGVDDPDNYVPVREAIGDLPDPLPPGSPADDPVHRTLSERPGVDDTRYTRNRVDPRSMSQPVPRNGDTAHILTNHKAADHAPETRKKMGDRELGRNSAPTTSRRLDPDSPSPTITGSNGTPPIHYRGYSPDNPDRDVNAVRRLTVRETARIQGFLDSFTVAGTRNEQFQQVANAVPPLLAHCLGKHIRHNMLGSVYDDETADREPTLG